MHFQAKEKVKEIAQLRQAVNASAKDHQDEKDAISSLREEITSLQEQARGYLQVIEELRAEAGKVSEVQVHFLYSVIT